jgi:AraC-like DNA-binding protein
MQPDVRAASLHGYVDLATSLGADAAALVAEAGLDIADLATPDRWIPAAGAARLLAATAAATGREDFGLLMSQRRRLSTLGPLSVVLREEPDARSALDLLLRYERSYNEALHLEVAESGGLATVRMRFEAGQPAPTEQTLDLATAALVGILRTFLGEDWTPLSVCFAHSAPADLTTYRRLLGERLQFDHAFTGIVVPSADLDRPNTGSDPTLRPYAQQLLSTLPTARPDTAADQVRELIELLLPLGRASVGQVARSQGVDRRTLHRHLAGHGETFTSLLHATRRRLAERHLANPRYSLTEVSGMLGFAAPSAFSRWFREQYDVAPQTWRASVRTGPASPRAARRPG